MNSLARILLLALSLVAAPAIAEPLRPVGVAKIDITPGYPVRLSGYGNRRELNEGISQRIFAKALAIGQDSDGPALLVTVDNVGVPITLRDEVLRRLVAKKTGVTDDRFAICSSHTHCAPMLSGVLPNLFSMDIPEEHVASIKRYTQELTDKVEQVALAALADRKPAQLAWGVGQVDFAMNRRSATQIRPVDHDLPVLRINTPDGKVRAMFTSYACHCTTLQFNFIHGDWAGCAQEALEREFPGAIVLTALGCGGDQNPQPRGTVELATQHGESLAAEAKRLVSGELKPVLGALSGHTRRLELPFATLPTREEWQKLAESKGANVAYHAKKNLARLDRGESIPAKLPYIVQAWSFGSDLSMVFLAGEVVVDYSLRLKREFDHSRLWVNAYSNDVPCYIPSKRILAEGGYEGATAMLYYDRPTKFAPEVEELIVGAVRDLVPREFAAKAGAALPPAKSPAASLAAIHTRPGLTVDLAAAEPLVVDPVAIDWGPDGKLWVVEMRDYPMGRDGNWKPGGVIKFLEDTDGDGRYDRATVFLEDLPFPTGVTAWGKGALICAAPDIIYAEDSDGDGRADVVRKLFTGFATDNYQARVNSLALGLDHWIHGANGLLGGVIRGGASSAEVDIHGRDFRMNPDTGAFEPASGVTQQGRCRDDWDNWFGCSNSAPLFHFPMPDHYARRNPHVAIASSRVNLPADEDPGRVFPASAGAERFNSPESLNHVTSGCGLGLCRDPLMGDPFYGDAFTCEPVHNLVHRLKLLPRSVTFEARRAPGESNCEFLASEDNWFRPVQVRTGPDGALWVVDMYRAVIEHPRWIPADKLANLDVRAGADMGRIYRVYPAGAKLRPIRDLTKLATADLAAALDTPNGTTRDLVHAELLHRPDKAAAAPALSGLLQSTSLPATRLQALCILDGLHLLAEQDLRRALQDAHPALRRHAIRLCESRLGTSPKLVEACLALAHDSDLGVRYQLALSLGSWNDPRAAAALGAVAVTASDDPWLRAAALSSSTSQPLDVLEAVLASPQESPGRGELIGGLVSTAARGSTEPRNLGRLLKAVAPKRGAPVAGWQVTGVLRLQDALDRRKENLGAFLHSPDAGVRTAAEGIKGVFESAARIAANAHLDVSARLDAVRLLGRGLSDPKADLPKLLIYLGPASSPDFQKAALDTLARSRDARVPAMVLQEWGAHGPAMRLAILNALLGRDAWTQGLLDAVETGAVSPNDVPTATRDRLAKHHDPAIRDRAATLLPLVRSADRGAVVARYAMVETLQGDGAKGAAIYQAVCSSCHAYLGQGHEVGPNINTFRKKSVQDFLVAILDPNAVVEPRYGAYIVQTRDGRMLSGVIGSETSAALVLAQPGGARETILRSDIVSLHGSPLSLMPEGLEQALTPQDMANLIAFLKGAG